MKKISIIALFSLLLVGTAFSKAPSHQIWNELLKKHVSAKGNVNYKGFISEKSKLESYLKLLSSNAPQSSWTKNEKLAYWINAYNAFTVKLIVDNYPVKSIKDVASKVAIPGVTDVWKIKFITIGGKKYDLNSIEHEILRKRFTEPRIHFAIVCASYSCPALLNEAYTPSKLEGQLSKQTTVFLKDTRKNKISATSPKISKIFEWFKEDFTKNGKTVRGFINRYSSVKISSNAKISYLPYGWSLNE